MNYFIYLIFAGIGNLLALLPFRILYFCSDLLYILVFYIVKYRKKVVFENLRNSFPEKSEQEIETIAKKFYHHFCDLLLEIVKQFHLPPEEIVRRMKIQDPNLFRDEFEHGKHVLMVLGHYGNWEWGTAIGLQAPHKFISIYKPLTNKYFDALMSKFRCQYKGYVVAMKQSGRIFIQHVNEGPLCQMNFIADQTPHLAEIQYWTTFLNQETPVFLGVEKLAQKTRQPVYFVKFMKVKRGFYQVIGEKLCDDASLLKSHEITELHVRALERAIIEAPEYWLWTHRRWKYKREKEIVS